MLSLDIYNKLIRLPGESCQKLYVSHYFMEAECAKDPVGCMLGTYV